VEKLSENQALMVLNALPDVGPCSARRLISHFRGDVRRIFSATAEQLRNIPKIDRLAADRIVNYRSFFDLAQEEEAITSLRGDFFGITHPNYPILLREIYDAPVGIYAIGKFDNFTRNIAIVGSRTNTLYGLETARMLAIELSKRGFCIVSGMARGIDTAAHEGALAAKGKTIAVLGNGIDIIYPSENAALYRRIAENGALISEFTLGRKADKQAFPIRNRLIAGLCHAVIIVESDRFGGSMITAKFANDYGRHVFAVPGRIDQPSSSGCLSLIREGATMLTSIDDIFDDLPYLDLDSEQITMFTDVGSGNRFFTNKLPRTSEISCPMERKIYEVLIGEKSATLDSITLLSELPLHTALHALQMLELRGLAQKRYDGRFEVKASVR
jgi:DNA processing protein